MKRHKFIATKYRITSAHLAEERTNLHCEYCGHVINKGSSNGDEYQKALDIAKQECPMGDEVNK